MLLLNFFVPSLLCFFTSLSYAMEGSGAVAAASSGKIFVKVRDGEFPMPEALLKLRPLCCDVADSSFFTDSADEKIIVNLADETNPDFSSEDLTRLAGMAKGAWRVFDKDVSVQDLKKLCLAIDKLATEHPEKFASLFARYARLASESPEGMSTTIESILKNKPWSVADVFDTHESIDIPQTCQHTDSEECDCDPEVIKPVLEKIIENGEYWRQFFSFNRINLEGLALRSLYGLQNFLTTMESVGRLLNFRSQHIFAIVEKSPLYQELSTEKRRQVDTFMADAVFLVYYIADGLLLNLNDNNLSHLDGIKLPKNLYGLRLDGNQFSDANLVTDLLSKYPKLRYLHINRNKLETIVLPEKVINYIAINASDNPIREIIVPDNFCNSLFWLRLHNTNLDIETIVKLQRYFKIDDFKKITGSDDEIKHNEYVGELLDLSYFAEDILAKYADKKLTEKAKDSEKSDKEFKSSFINNFVTSENNKIPGKQGSWNLLKLRDSL
jgi:hypothetical protein